MALYYVSVEESFALGYYHSRHAVACSFLDFYRKLMAAMVPREYPSALEVVYSKCSNRALHM
eukprot:4260789-Amphidinium_carterae.1